MSRASYAMKRAENEKVSPFKPVASDAFIGTGNETLTHLHASVIDGGVEICRG